MRLRGDKLFNLVVIFEIKKGQNQAFLQVINTVIENTLKESGNLQYELSLDEADPQKYFLYEKYQDRKAYELHTQQHYLQNMRASLAEVLAKPAEVLRGSSVS